MTGAELLARLVEMPDYQLRYLVFAQIDEFDNFVGFAYCPECDTEVEVPADGPSFEVQELRLKSEDSRLYLR